MPNPPSKGEEEVPGHSRVTSAKTRHTHSTAAAADNVANPTQGSRTSSAQADIELFSVSPLQHVAFAITDIIANNKLPSQVKLLLEGIIKFTKEEEDRQKKIKDARDASSIASAVHKAIKEDISQVHSSLTKQLNDIQETANATLTGTDRIQNGIESVHSMSKELDSKVAKVTGAADQLVAANTPYRDAVLSKTPQALKAHTDPKVLGDMERKAKQILVEIYDTEGNDTMAKSLTELKDRANATLAAIEERDKPKDARVDTVLKTRTRAVVLTFNCKEIITWLKEPENEHVFTKGFSEGSHIKERQFNVIVPRVPTTFNPDAPEHLREVEETNGLKERTILKAKWIKPVSRRRADQTHAYAIISVSSAEAANLLIRDGMIICSTRVRPNKQKHEPVQCMKCRGWGHFAGNCTAEKDTCGTCGRDHRTSTCKITSKVFCATCKDSSHPSWDRNCPESIRRRAIYDEKNPENELVFYPTDQDWTLTTRPQRIPLEERFPQCFAVNSLQHHSCPNPRSQEDQRGARRRAKGKQKENPNLIPVSQAREEGETPYNAEMGQCFDDPDFTDWCKYDEVDAYTSTLC